MRAFVLYYSRPANVSDLSANCVWSDTCSIVIWACIDDSVQLPFFVGLG